MTGGPEVTFGGHLGDSGATLTPVYHQGEQGIVGVPIMDIQDAASSALEERLLAAVGTFFASGAFWLGVDKLLSEGSQNPIFMVCVVSFFCGLALAWVGYRQSARRVNRLQRYCPQA